jgi:integral membrane protein (TIGR00529 family)
LGIVDPAVAIIIAFALLIILLYKRVNLGITLNVTAITLALLALEWTKMPTVIYEASIKPETVSVVIATFGIMLLSQLYKETGVINKLSESISRLIKNPKIVLGLVPAVIGLLPVAGGALMSAPLVDIEAEKLKLEPQRKAYLNLWFRHTIFPVYPLSLPIIVTAMLTDVTIPLIILRQIPTVLVMIIVGYVIGFWKIKTPEKEESKSERSSNSNFKAFLLSFSPILATIVFAIALGATGIEFFKQSRDIVIAVFIGIAVLIAISKMKFATFAKPFKNWGIYGITLAAYGAFLLREVMISPEISQVFSQIVANGNSLYSGTVLLVTLPAVLGVLTGSPVSGVAISIPILFGDSPVAANTAALIYISAYLGYTIAPTHLCFTFTADYFECQLGEVYKYVIPSFILTFLTALLVYFLL